MKHWPRLVYFARRTDGTGPIKIGCSTGPACRVKQLGFDYGAKFEVLAEASGSLGTERGLHRRFAYCHTAAPVREDRIGPLPGDTEWFEAVPELLELIDGIKAGTVELPKWDERDEAIVKLYATGETLEVVGKTFGLTRERIRQILFDMGVERRSGAETARIKRRIKFAQWQAQRVAA
jgi:hypothetical protein